jgi:hypothetical protein
LEALLNDPRLWRGGQGVLSRAEGKGLPSGFPELDRALPWEGWPLGALTELLPAREGIGELRLVIPALARLSQEGRWQVWVRPPYLPYAPVLAAYGVKLSRLLLVYPRTNRERLWAIEQALRSGACGAVLAWPKTADFRTLRRLQLAAEAGHGFGLLTYPPQADIPHSPATLRLRLEPVLGGVLIHVLKRRGGGPLGPLFLTMDSAGTAPRGSQLVLMGDVLIT